MLKTVKTYTDCEVLVVNVNLQHRLLRKLEILILYIHFLFSLPQKVTVKKKIICGRKSVPLVQQKKKRRKMSLDIFKISKKNLNEQVLKNGAHQMHRYPEYFRFVSPLSNSTGNNKNILD